MIETPPHLAETRLADVTLAATLDQMRLNGAIFFRAELTDAFAFESAPLAFADRIVPDPDRLIVFHIVVTGECWVTTDGAEPQWAQAGDVIVMPYGDRYVMGGRTPVTPTPLELPGPPPWKSIPLARVGGGGPRTEVVCGYLHSAHPLFDPVLRALPAAFVVRPPVRAAAWVRASVDYAMDARPDAEAVPAAERLPELVLTEVLRVHLATAPTANHGWLAALGDPVLAPALALIHGQPGHNWSVTELATRTHVSRSQLDGRFRQLLGLSPIRYLTLWRMRLARDWVTTTDLTVGAIGRKVGYQSEEAFSRAFKREHGVPPSRLRSRRRESGS
jgi:AraC-like DNA-binding protein